MQIIYTDGACKGNGKEDSNKDGGWGVFIIADDHARCVWGYEADTSNNKTELIAIIQALALSDPNRPVTIYSDSTYSLDAIAKCQNDWESKGFRNGSNFKGKVAANIDLIKEVNTLLKGRVVTFVKVAAHNGDTGNEMADVLANLGAEQRDNGDIVLPSQTNLSDYLAALSHHIGKRITLSKTSKPTKSTNQPKSAKTPTNTKNTSLEEKSPKPATVSKSKPKKSKTKDDDKTKSAITALDNAIAPNTKPVKKSPKLTSPPPLDEERWLIFDTETTGLHPNRGDRIVEIGVLEMVGRTLTGERLHYYLNPKRPMPEEAFNIHGLSDEFLADKPVFSDIAKPLYEFMAGATLIAHNAEFDLKFLIQAFDEAGLPPLLGRVHVIDTLALAKALEPNKRARLDDLVERFNIPKRDRSYHGALLDSEILAEVYLAMTGGQTALDTDPPEQSPLDLARLYREYYQRVCQAGEGLVLTSSDGTEMTISAPTHRGAEERWLIFDTETTGFDPKKGDRIVEVGVVELVGRKPTGNRVHLYINPKRPMPEEAFNIHGLSDEFLADKPVFSDIAKPLYEFMAGATLIAHNAEFDMRFMVAEFAKAGFFDFDKVVSVIDSLVLARKQYAGQGNSLDALVKRLGIPKRDRSYHGALLDSEILAEVYLAMTGGQTALDIDETLSLSNDGSFANQTLTHLQHLLKNSTRNDEGDLAWRHSVLGYTS